MDNKNKAEIEELFGKDAPPIQRLGQGTHTNSFYYCVSDSDGFPIVITSHREYYRKFMSFSKDENKPRTINNIKQYFV